MSCCFCQFILHHFKDMFMVCRFVSEGSAGGVGGGGGSFASLQLLILLKYATYYF
jgi:hypothetical protein